ncbi:GyrI-like domain-containing protein [Cohnella sp. REN36]|uniref:GyrI-like domain-containing protein n=1 Tax=Cohnella sp. REN36 TaxID=2887347 RepID=UPI001D14E42C|nr:GyrI-like domain-containing protein [Cohnella sp. REN36]MCC3372629.1 GyrI-like domain-containing protein [Cohnella sp. REN36]
MKLIPTKLDLSKADKTYYSATNRPALVHLDALSYLSIADKGAPDGPVFANATEALYTVAYGVKGLCKKENQDFTVPKLEGLWWVESDKYALEVPREEWHWKLLIRMPDFVNRESVDSALANAIAKKKDLEQVHRVVFETLHEGACVQMMHIGPYRTEPDTIEKIHSFMKQHSFVQNGLHHEIYLSDPRKVDPSSMKTILRFPVKQQK